MAKWNPAKKIVQALRRLQGQIARAIQSAAPRVPHRDGSVVDRRTGGRLDNAVRSTKLLIEKRWGGVLALSQLGQKFLFFVEGTKRQKARPVPLVPDVDKLTRDLSEDAARHYEKRARGRP